MKKLLCILIVLALFSCKPKSNEPVKQKTQAEYLQDALRSDTYKNAYLNLQRVKQGLDSVKKGVLKPEVVIFEYNNSIATPTSQVKTIAQVQEGMKKDTAYLKAVQLKVAADMASSDSAKMKH